MRKLLITIGLITGAGSVFAGPIHDAASRGDIDEIKSLLNIGVNVDHIDEYKETPLFKAVKGNKYEVADLLISVGANVNHQKSRGVTPIFDALGPTKSKILKLLISNGANVDHSVDNGESPLFYAYGESMNILLDSGADINHQNNLGQTLLMLSANSYDSVKLLLENGAKVFLKDIQGQTAMHHAVVRGGSNANLLKLILSHKATINALDTYGKTPLDYMHDEMFGTDRASKLQFLKEAGAKTGLQLLEEKVEQGSTGNTNPTDEWPRKLWEIDFNAKFNSAELELGKDKSMFLSLNWDNGVYKYWVTGDGQYEKIEAIGYKGYIHIDNSNFIYKLSDNTVIGLFRRQNQVEKRTFKKKNISNHDWESPNGFLVQLTWDGTKVTAWDFTPPTLASTDQEGGNNGGNTAMSRLSIGTSGPDISIATDGKLGGPAELQKSNDLKNWRKLGDVPADSAELLITPRDSGNEFFRLKRVGE